MSFRQKLEEILLKFSLQEIINDNLTEIEPFTQEIIQLIETDLIGEDEQDIDYDPDFPDSPKMLSRDELRDELRQKLGK